MISFWACDWEWGAIIGQLLKLKDRLKLSIGFWTKLTAHCELTIAGLGSKTKFFNLKTHPCLISPHGLIQHFTGLWFPAGRHGNEIGRGRLLPKDAPVAFTVKHAEIQSKDYSKSMIYLAKTWNAPSCRTGHISLLIPNIIGNCLYLSNSFNTSESNIQSQLLDTQLLLLNFKMPQIPTSVPIEAPKGVVKEQPRDVGKFVQHTIHAKWH
jgi:hypothetical protein